MEIKTENGRFTYVYENVVSQLIARVTLVPVGHLSSVCSILHTNGGKRSSGERGNKGYALWDTGIARSVLSREIINDYGIEPIRDGGTDIYPINFTIPDAFSYINLMCVAGDLGKSVYNSNEPEISRVPLSLVVGMDVLGSGDFAITNKAAKTMFSFQLTSLESIDFVSQ